MIRFLLLHRRDLLRTELLSVGHEDGDARLHAFVTDIAATADQEAWSTMAEAIKRMPEEHQTGAWLAFLKKPVEYPTPRRFMPLDDHKIH